MKKVKEAPEAPKSQQQQALATEEPKQLPAVINFQEDANKGLEGADKDSYAIPFLMILQPGSPGVVDSSIEGAKAGMFINSVTKELIVNPLLVPCAFQRRWIRWAPRETGGGFKGEFTTAQVNEMRAAGQVVDLEGRLYFPAQDGSVNPKTCDRLSDTRSHFCLVLRHPQDEMPLAAVFALASTAIKISKNFISRIDSVKLKTADGKSYTPASFSHAYAVKTVMKKNEKGTWWLPEIDMHGPITSAAVYASAKAFHKQVSEGKVEVAHDSAARMAERDVGDDDRM